MRSHCNQEIILSFGSAIFYYSNVFSLTLIICFLLLIENGPFDQKKFHFCNTIRSGRHCYKFECSSEKVFFFFHFSLSLSLSVSLVHKKIGFNFFHTACFFPLRDVTFCNVPHPGNDGLRSGTKSIKTSHRGD